MFQDDVLKDTAENHFPESSLFKIPERLATLYVTEGRFDLEDEFKFRVEHGNLKRLLFEEVWRDENGS
jgi:hypothetical protein